MTMQATDAPSYSDDLAAFVENDTANGRVRLELAHIAYDIADTLASMHPAEKEAAFFYITRHERYQEFPYTDYLLTLLRELNVEASATEFAPGKEYWKVKARLLDPEPGDEDGSRYE